MQQCWQACGGENRPALPAGVRSATDQAALACYPDAGAGQPHWSAGPTDQAKGAAGTGARDALHPMQWADGFSRVSIRRVLILFSTLVAPLTEKFDMVAMRTMPPKSHGTCCSRSEAGR